MIEQKLIEFLHNRKNAVLTAPDLKTFLDSQGADAEAFRRYTGMEPYFETVKAHPDAFLMQPLAFPRARGLSDLFEHMVFLPWPSGIMDKRAQREAQDIFDAFTRRGYRHLSCGIRGHVDGRFHMLYAKPKPEVRESVLWYDREVGPVYYEIAERSDGHLLIGKPNKIIASQWLALLAPIPTLEPERIEPSGAAGFARKSERGDWVIRQAVAVKDPIPRHDAPWEAVRRDTGEVVASAATPFDAALAADCGPA